jgi:hypothetical protein
MTQPNLFEEEETEPNKIILYALGEFQSRKKVLADRELPLDRLRGAFKRACEKFNLDEFSDEEIAGSLEKLGAKITQVPSFVAKHPFRVIVSSELAEASLKLYKSEL